MTGRSPGVNDKTFKIGVRPRLRAGAGTTRVVWKASKLIAVAGLVCILADVAMADLLPSPFGFSFFTPGLTDLFLWPLSLAGCG